MKMKFWKEEVYSIETDSTDSIIRSEICWFGWRNALMNYSVQTAQSEVITLNYFKIVHQLRNRSFCELRKILNRRYRTKLFLHFFYLSN